MVAAAWAGRAGRRPGRRCWSMPRAASTPTRARILDGLKARRTARRAGAQQDRPRARARRCCRSPTARPSAASSTRVFMISGLDRRRRRGFGAIIWRGALPEGPWLFPEDQLSDLPLRLLAAEMMREQVFLQLHQELPYAITVETENGRSARTAASASTSHHPRRARQPEADRARQGRRADQAHRRAPPAPSSSALLERRVHLFLHVRVSEDWTEDRERYAGDAARFRELSRERDALER